MYNIPFIILNDQLCVRDYSNPDTWRLQASVPSINEVNGTKGQYGPTLTFTDCLSLGRYKTTDGC